MFESASNIVITGGSFAIAQHHAGIVDNKADENIKLVYGNVSWNAILNSDGRAESTRCYPGTRKAVLEHIEGWINAKDDKGQRIFWLSGPAGAGKSAIAQSIAERCLERGIPTANFFFFRADNTRNNASPLAATLLYQLFDICPAIKRHIRDFIAQYFHVFDTPVEQQLKALFLSLLTQRGRVWSGKHKILLILDGLDECSSEDDTVQQDIVRTLHDIVAQKHSPFILLVSSRAEPHLAKSFNAVQSQVARLYLDGDSFSSSDNIRRFVIGEFGQLKKTHHLAGILDEDWPSPADVEAIVSKSSGHFIYAATIMRFFHTSPESPLLNLERVEGIRPVESTSPFAQLDAVYTHILAKARNWLKARDILAAQILPDVQDATIHPKSSWTGTTPLAKTSYILDALGYNLHEISSYTADLTALVKVGEFGEVKFYHTSLGDFLLDKKRSLNFFIDLNKFRLKLVLALFNSFGGRMDNLSWSLIVEHFMRLKETSDAMTKALSSSPLLSSRLSFNGTTLCAFLDKIKELYFEADVDLYKSILKQWLTWFYQNRGMLQRSQLGGIQYATELWDELLSTPLPRAEIFEETDDFEDEEQTSSDTASSTVTETSPSPRIKTPPLLLQSVIVSVTQQSYEDIAPAASLNSSEFGREPINDDMPDDLESGRDIYDLHEQLPLPTQPNVLEINVRENEEEATYQRFREDRNLETRESRRRTIELYTEGTVEIERSPHEGHPGPQAVVQHQGHELERQDVQIQRREEELDRREAELDIREQDLDRELERRVGELVRREEELERREILQHREERLLLRVEALLSREEMLVRREEELFQQRRRMFSHVHRSRASHDWNHGWFSRAQSRGAGE